MSERAEQKQSIERQLSERRQLLASVQDEIAQLEAQERRRQAQLAAEARARLAAQAAAQQQANASRIQLQELEPQAPSFEDPSYPSADVPAARYGGVVGVAMQYLGTPYVWGGASPGGFDCSGFIQVRLHQVGVSLPHTPRRSSGTARRCRANSSNPATSSSSTASGTPASTSAAGSSSTLPHTGDVVKISSMNDSWYSSGFVGARRL